MGRRREEEGGGGGGGEGLGVEDGIWDDEGVGFFYVWNESPNGNGFDTCSFH